MLFAFAFLLLFPCLEDPLVVIVGKGVPAS